MKQAQVIAARQESVVEWIWTVAITTVAAFWGSIDPWLKVLFLLMVLDTVAAIWRHVSAGTIDIKTATAGANKKAMIAILVTTSIILQYYVANTIGYTVPLTMAVAGFYTGRELLSILRHASASGLSIPQPLIDVGERIEQATGGEPPKRSEVPDAGKP